MTHLTLKGPSSRVVNFIFITPLACPAVRRPPREQQTWVGIQLSPLIFYQFESHQCLNSLHTHVLICGHRHRVACLQTSTYARCVLRRMSLFLVTRFASKKQSRYLRHCHRPLNSQFLCRRTKFECTSFCFVVLFEGYCLVTCKLWEQLGME